MIYYFIGTKWPKWLELFEPLFNFVVFLICSFVFLFEPSEEFRSLYKWVTFLPPNRDLLPSGTRHLALAPCQRAVCQRACESQITLWWRVRVLTVVCIPSTFSTNTYEDLLKERAEQRGPALTWQATMATGKEAGRTEAGGRRTGGWWELLWPAYRGHSALVSPMIIWLVWRTNNQRTTLPPLKQKNDLKAEKDLSWRQ